MKILLYGEYWEGTIIRNMAHVLRKKNIEFEVFDFFKIINYNYSNQFANKVIRRVFYKNNESKVNKLFLEKFHSYKPDIVFVSKGLNLYPETINHIKMHSVLLANWNPDDFFNSYNSNSNLLNSINLYDKVFSARKHLFDDYRNRGISNPIYLEWYYVPWLHEKPPTLGNKKPIITLIGSYSPRREKIISEIDEKFNIEIWGGGWSNSKINNKKNILNHNKELFQKDFPKVIANSLVNLNSLTLENRDLTNLKLFEVTACSGLLITENSSTSFEILEKDKEAFYYNPNEKQDLNEVLSYIFDPKNRNEIEEVRINGYNKIMTNFHSVEDRIEKVITEIGL